MGSACGCGTKKHSVLVASVLSPVAGSGSQSYQALKDDSVKLPESVHACSEAHKAETVKPTSKSNRERIEGAELICVNDGTIEAKAADVEFLVSNADNSHTGNTITLELERAGMEMEHLRAVAERSQSAAAHAQREAADLQKVCEDVKAESFKTKEMLRSLEETMDRLKTENAQLQAKACECDELKVKIHNLQSQNDDLLSIAREREELEVKIQDLQSQNDLLLSKARSHEEPSSDLCEVAIDASKNDCKTLVGISLASMDDGEEDLTTRLIKWISTEGPSQAGFTKQMLEQVLEQQTSLKEELRQLREDRVASVERLADAASVNSQSFEDIKKLQEHFSIATAEAQRQKDVAQNLQLNVDLVPGDSPLDMQALEEELKAKKAEVEMLRDELMQLHAEEGCTPLADGGWLNLASVVRAMRNKRAIRAAAEADLFAAKESHKQYFDAEKEALIDGLNEEPMWFERSPEKDLVSEFEKRFEDDLQVDDVEDCLAQPPPFTLRVEAQRDCAHTEETLEEEEDDDEDEQCKSGPEVGMREVKKGVYVFVRFRPALSHEMGEDHASWNCDDAKSLTYRARRFRYDAVLGSTSTQTDVYRLVNLVPKRALEGFSTAVMNYGGTGSGKTYTMVGRGGDMGIAPSIAQSLLSRIEQRRDRAEARGETATYAVTVSMLEIYNECTIDLLQPKCQDVHVRVLQGNVTVEGLTAVPMTSVERVIETVQAGFLARHQASTCGNSESSRGHAILIFDVKGHRSKKTTEINSEARIFLVDLAGCENLSKAQLSEDALKKLSRKPNPHLAIHEAQMALQSEMKRINRSLSTLRKVIEEAAQKKGAPVAAMCRESKLTLVLRECFGGRNLAVLLCCCSPLEKHSPPTLNTLEFGDVFRKMENAPLAGEVTTPDWRLVAEGLRRALCRIHALFAEQLGNSAPVDGKFRHAIDAGMTMTSKALHDSDAAFGFPTLPGVELAEVAGNLLGQLFGSGSHIPCEFNGAFGRDAGHPERIVLHLRLARPRFALTLPEPPVSIDELQNAMLQACKSALAGRISSDLTNVRVTLTELLKGEGGHEGVNWKGWLSAQFIP